MVQHNPCSIRPSPLMSYENMHVSACRGCTRHAAGQGRACAGSVLGGTSRARLHQRRTAPEPLLSTTQCLQWRFAPCPGQRGPEERLARSGADAANDFGMSTRAPSASGACAAARLGLVPRPGGCRKSTLRRRNSRCSRPFGRPGPRRRSHDIAAGHQAEHSGASQRLNDKGAHASCRAPGPRTQQWLPDALHSAQARLRSPKVTAK